jgi:arsenite oxidase large subunit
MYNEFVRNRRPMAFVEINPDDAQSLGVSSGDVVELFNDYGSAHTMAYLEPSIKKNQTFMQFGYWNGIAGDVVTPWTDRNVIPHYKETWAGVRRVGTVADFKEAVSFKQRRWVQQGSDSSR